jgi:transcriptional regulator with XRE-family HTH domain
MRKGSRHLDKAIGKTIERERRRHGLTQVRLARMCGVSRRHLAAIERGGNFSVAILLDVAQVLAGKALRLGDYVLLYAPEANDGGEA